LSGVLAGAPGIGHKRRGALQRRSGRQRIGAAFPPSFARVVLCPGRPILVVPYSHDQPDARLPADTAWRCAHSAAGGLLRRIGGARDRNSTGGIAIRGARVGHRGACKGGIGRQGRPIGLRERYSRGAKKYRQDSHGGDRSATSGRAGSQASCISNRGNAINARIIMSSVELNLGAREITLPMGRPLRCLYIRRCLIRHASDLDLPSRYLES
jgi:hypothetical protein